MLLNHVDGVLEVLIDVAVKRSLERDEHNTIFFSDYLSEITLIIFHRGSTKVQCPSNSPS